jgi:hypothetical protein
MMNGHNLGVRPPIGLLSVHEQIHVAAGVTANILRTEAKSFPHCLFISAQQNTTRICR